MDGATTSQHALGGTPFTRLVCGVDGSPEAIEAARLACRLAPGRPVTLVAAVDVLGEATRARDVPALAHILRDRAADALEEVVARLEADGVAGTVGRVTEEGHVPDVLRYAVGGDAGSLVALGACDGLLGLGLKRGPAGAAYLARVAIRTVREVPCSVLVAHPARRPGDFPSSVAVGVDGSITATDAYRVAASLAASREASLGCVAALDGKELDLEAARAAAEGTHLEVVRGPPVTALLSAGDAVDLLVLGHRGLHGLWAFGSVSERVLARARTSVLVVRRR